MSDVVGKAVVVLAAEKDQFVADMRQSAQEVRQFSGVVTDASGKSSTALTAIGTAAGASAQQLSTAQKRVIESLERQVAAMQGGKVAAIEMKASQLGIADAAAPLIARMRELEAAQRASVAAGGEAISVSRQAAETEAQAASRIRDVVAASLEKTAALNKEIEASRAAATASRELGGSAKTLPGNSGISLAAQNRSLQETANEVAEVNRALAAIGRGAASTKDLQAQTDKLLDLWGRGRISAEQYADAVKKLDASEAVLVKSTAQASAAGDQFIAKLKEQAATAGMTSKQLLEYRAAQLGVSKDAAPLIASLAATEGAADKLNLTSKASTRQFMELSRAVQYGEWGRVPSQLGDVAQATGLLGSRLLGTVVAFGAVAAGVAAVGYAAAKGHAEQAQFSNALILTGNYAGETAAGLHDIAVQASSMGGSLSVAKAAVLELASGGKFTSQQITLISTAATQMEEATGQAVSKTISQFVELGNEPAKASAKLNEQYHYLTVSVYEQIAALEKQGNAQAAADLAERTYASAMSARSVQIQENIGFIGRAWLAAKHEAAAYWDTALGIGRKSSTTDKIAVANNQLNSMLQMGNVAPDSRAAKEIAAKRAEIAELQATAAKEKQAGIDASTEKQVQAEGIAAAAYLNGIQEKTKGLSKLEIATTKYYEMVSNYNKAKPAGEQYSESQMLKDLEQLKKDNTEKPKAKSESGINAAIKELQGQYQEQERALKRSIENSKAQYNMGLLDTQQFLDAQYQARKDALAKEMDLAKQQEKVAGAKKSAVGIEEVKNLQKKIRDEQLANEAQYTADSGLLLRKNALDIKAYSDALNAAYNTRQLAINNLIAGTGLGDMARDQLSRINAIRQEYDRAVADLVKQKDKGDGQGGLSQAKYDERIALLQADAERRVALEEAVNDRVKASQSDAWNGATRFLQNYGDQAANIASQVEGAFNTAAKGMEDAFATFVTTGKLSFSSLATAVIADIAKMQARAAISGLFNFAMSAAANYFGGGGMGTADGAQPAGNFQMNNGVLGQRAAGGPTSANGLYQVNERGPELLTVGGKDYLMMGNQAGNVTSNERILAPVTAGLRGNSNASAGGVQVNIYMQPDGQSNVEAPAGMEQFGKEVGTFVDGRIDVYMARAQRQGGPLWKMRNGVAA